MNTQNVLKMEESMISQSMETFSYSMQSLDTQLIGAQSSMIGYAANNTSMIQLSLDNSSVRAHARQDIYKGISNLLLYQNILDYLCVSSLSYDEYADAASSGMNYYEIIALRNIARHCSSEDIENTYSWNLCHTPQGYFLTYYLFGQQYTFFGAICLNQYISSLSDGFLSDTKGTLIISTQNLDTISDAQFLEKQEVTLSLNEPSYYTTGSKNLFQHNYTAYQIKSSASDLSLWTIIPTKELTKSIKLQRFLTYLFCILGILFVPIFSLNLYHMLLKPLESLKDTMLKIKQGNQSITIIENFSSREFNDIRDTFNEMLQKTRTLNQQILTDRQKYQQAELNYLRMQIRPHFFLNAITTITNFASLGKLNDMYVFSDYLSRHIRFMFRNNLLLINLSQELQHIEDYLCLQNLRFEDSLFYFIDCPPHLLTKEVPPFIIYTFVENCIKHLASHDHITNIYITIQETPEGIQFLVEDDGIGYSKEFLSKYNTLPYPEPKDGYHIGIYNIGKVIDLLYGKKAFIRFSNIEPRGASVFIQLPNTTDKKGVENYD